MKFDTINFNKTYKGSRKFSEDSPYFPIFIESLEKNKELFERIKFCNDVLQIPPIYTFVKYHKDVFYKQMAVNEKRGLGACFGYLYQFIYNEGYKAQTTWVGHKETGIKNASYFKK